jgi:hypothetical protein
MSEPSKYRGNLALKIKKMLMEDDSNDVASINTILALKQN